ncbi:UNVERIFIED_CONTAM: hypothetical protein FKN15_040325 [Acipenser sinensis]
MPENTQAFELGQVSLKKTVLQQCTFEVTRQCFSLKNTDEVKFNYWDEEWEAFVDLEDCSLLQDRSKLQEYEELTNSSSTIREFYRNTFQKCSRILELGRTKLEKLYRTNTQSNALKKEKLAKIINNMNTAIEEERTFEDPSKKVAYHQAVACAMILPLLLGEESLSFVQEYPACGGQSQPGQAAGSLNYESEAECLREAVERAGLQ